MAKIDNAQSPNSSKSSFEVEENPQTGPPYFQDGMRTSFIDLEAVQGTPIESRLTVQGATMSLVTAVVGAGVVAIPRAVGQAGFIGGFGLVAFCGILATTMVRLLCSAFTLAETMGHTIKSYDDLAAAAVPASCQNFARAFTSLVVNVTVFGVSSIVVLLLGLHIGMLADHVQGIPPDAPPNEHSFPMNGIPFGGWMLVALIVLLPTSWLQDMSAIGRLSSIGVIGTFGTCLVMFLGSIVHIFAFPNATKPTVHYIEPNLFTLVSSFCTIIFSFGGVSVIPTMRHQMDHPQDMAKASGNAMMIVATLYAVIAVPAVLAWGIPGDSVLQAMGGNELLRALQLMAIVLLCCNLSLTYPIALNVVINTLGKFVPAVMQKSPTALVLRSALVLTTFCVAFFFKDFGRLLTLVAVVTVVCNMIYFPIGCYWGLLIRQAGFVSAVKSSGVIVIVWHAIAICSGLLAMCIGVYLAF